MTYTFPATNLMAVLDHANALDIVVKSITLAADTYTLVTVQPFPAEQLDHLGLTEV